MADGEGLQMQNARTTRSIGLLATGVIIAGAIVTIAPAPLALLLALIALPVEAFLIATAIHGLTNPELASQQTR